MAVDGMAEVQEERMRGKNALTKKQPVDSSCKSKEERCCGWRVRPVGTTGGRGAPEIATAAAASGELSTQGLQCLVRWRIPIPQGVDGEWPPIPAKKRITV